MSAETLSISAFLKYIWVPVIGYLFKRNWDQEKEIQKLKKETLTKEETRQLLNDLIGPIKEDVGEVKGDVKELRKSLEFLMTRRRVDKNEPD